MTASELTTWQVYEQVEPFGEYAAWLRWAQSLAAFVNAHRGKKGAPAKPQDFLPDFFGAALDEAEPPLAFGDVAALFKGLQSAQAKRPPPR